MGIGGYGDRQPATSMKTTDTSREWLEDGLHKERNQGGGGRLWGNI